MAERITGGPTLGYSREVGWERWADGSQYRLVRGTDFTQPPSQARRAFLSWAARWDFATHSSAARNGSVLVIQAYPRGRRFPEKPAVPLDVVAEALGCSVDEAAERFPLRARSGAYRAGGLNGPIFVPRSVLDRYLTAEGITSRVELDGDEEGTPDPDAEPDLPEPRVSPEADTCGATS